MNIHAKKSLGQNFLVNPHIVDKIVSAAEVSKDDIILEVGPGTGNLTKKLAEKARKVIAVEKDHRLIEPLKDTFKNLPNTEIIEADILLWTPSRLQLPPSQYKIVANIPYYITSKLLRTIFESANWRMTQPELIILTVQKEVAQRIMAKPPYMNLLALSVQYYSEPEVVSYISKNNFRPIPKVDSAIVRFKPKAASLKPETTKKLFKLIQTGFSEKRKQLVNNLAKLGYSKKKIIDFMESKGVNPKTRAEELSLEQWQELLKYLDT